MIKVTIGGEPKNEKKVTYPCLMKCVKGTGSGFIVLFTAARKGTVVFANLSQYNVGHYDENWADDAFIKFQEPITLQNITE